MSFRDKLKANIRGYRQGKREFKATYREMYGPTLKDVSKDVVKDGMQSIVDKYKAYREKGPYYKRIKNKIVGKYHEVKFNVRYATAYTLAAMADRLYGIEPPVLQTSANVDEMVNQYRDSKMDELTFGPRNARVEKEKEDVEEKVVLKQDKAVDKVNDTEAVMDQEVVESVESKQVTKQKTGKKLELTDSEEQLIELMYKLTDEPDKLRDKLNEPNVTLHDVIDTVQASRQNPHFDFKVSAKAFYETIKQYAVPEDKKVALTENLEAKFETIDHERGVSRELRLMQARQEELYTRYPHLRPADNQKLAPVQIEPIDFKDQKVRITQDPNDQGYDMTVIAMDAKRERELIDPNKRDRVMVKPDIEKEQAQPHKPQTKQNVDAKEKLKAQSKQNVEAKEKVQAKEKPQFKPQSKQNVDAKEKLKAQSKQNVEQKEKVQAKEKPQFKPQIKPQTKQTDTFDEVKKEVKDRRTAPSLDKSATESLKKKLKSEQKSALERLKQQPDAKEIKASLDLIDTFEEEDKKETLVLAR